MGGLFFGEDSFFDGVFHVGRPYEEVFVALVVVAVGPGFGGVEGFVGVEFVDEEEESVVVSGVAVEPVGGGGHGAGSGVVGFVAEPGAAGVVGVAEPSFGGGQGGGAGPTGVVA